MSLRRKLAVRAIGLVCGLGLRSLMLASVAAVVAAGILATVAWPRAVLSAIRAVDSSKGGALGNAGWDGGPMGMTPDGRYVVFATTASNLVARDRNGPGSSSYATDIFRKDLRTGDVRLVSVTTTGVQAKDGPQNPSVSADGRYIVFNTEGISVRLAKTAITMDADTAPSEWKPEPLPRFSSQVVLLKDMSTGKLLLVSHNPADSSGAETSGGFEPVISGDGRYVAFVGSDNRATGAATGALYLRDRVTGALTREDVRPGGSPGKAGVMWPSISGDGRFIAFCSFGNLGVGGFGGVFLKDTKSGELRNLSHYCEFPKITANGRYVLFRNRSGVLVRYDRVTRKLLRLGAVGVLSSTGRYFAGSDRGGGNAYIEDLSRGTRSVISLTGRTPTGVYPTASPAAVSATGRRIVLATAGTPDGRYRAHLVVADR